MGGTVEADPETYIGGKALLGTPSKRHEAREMYQSNT